MPPKYRWIKVVIGAVTLLFGLGCLNYTRSDGLDHHRQQAARYHLPPPGPAIFNIGVATTVAGAGLVGFGIGSRRKKRRGEGSPTDAVRP